MKAGTPNDHRQPSTPLAHDGPIRQGDGPLPLLRQTNEAHRGNPLPPSRTHRPNPNRGNRLGMAQTMADTNTQTRVTAKQQRNSLEGTPMPGWAS
jgi:hypothetical protein